MEITETLIQKGADINRQNIGGDSPVMLAAGNGHLDIVKLLIEQGADLSLRNSSSRNILMQASAYDQEEVVEYLLRQGMKPYILEKQQENLYGTALCHHLSAEFCAEQDDNEQVINQLRTAETYYQKASKSYEREASSINAKIMGQQLARTLTKSLIDATLDYTVNRMMSHSSEVQARTWYQHESMRQLKKCRTHEEWFARKRALDLSYNKYLRSSRYSVYAPYRPNYSTSNFGGDITLGSVKKVIENKAEICNKQAVLCREIRERFETTKTKADLEASLKAFQQSL
jgi:hypothetical protein